MGCTLAPPGEYDWTVSVRWWCSLTSNDFYHLFASVTDVVLSSRDGLIHLQAQMMTGQLLVLRRSTTGSTHLVSSPVLSTTFVLLPWTMVTTRLHQKRLSSTLGNRKVSSAYSLLSGNSIGHINGVTLHWARLVLRWATVCRYTILVGYQPLRPTQPPTLSWAGNEYQLRGQWQCWAAGKVTVGLA